MNKQKTKSYTLTPETDKALNRRTWKFIIIFYLPIFLSIVWFFPGEPKSKVIAFLVSFYIVEKTVRHNIVRQNILWC